jgi:hypothetical protein
MARPLVACHRFHGHRVMLGMLSPSTQYPDGDAVRVFCWWHFGNSLPVLEIQMDSPAGSGTGVRSLLKAASREPVEGVTNLPFSASYLATIWAGMRAARLICSAVAC